jgi:hypothetical protein
MKMTIPKRKLDEGDGDLKVEVILWKMPNSLANLLLGMLAKRDEAGYNITVSRTGTGFMAMKKGRREKP